MNQRERFKKTIEVLVERSKENRVHWARLEGRTASEQRFEVAFSGDVKLLLSAWFPESAPDRFTVDLVTTGANVVSISVEDGDPDFDLLQSLYDEAYRSTTHWDSALDEIEKALATGEEIGEPQAPL